MFRTVPVNHQEFFTVHSNGIAHTGLLTYTIAAFTVKNY